MTVSLQENMAAANAVIAAAVARKTKAGSLERGFKGSDNKRYTKLVKLRQKQSARLRDTVNQVIELRHAGEHDKAMMIESEIKSGLNTIYEKTQPDNLLCPPAEQIYYLMMTQIVVDAGFEHLLPERKGFK